MAVRTLNVVLDLDSGKFSGGLTDAGGKLKTFSQSIKDTGANVNDMGKTLSSIEHAAAGPIAKFRDFTVVLYGLREGFAVLKEIGVDWVADMVKQAGEVQKLTILMEGLSTATSEVGRAQEAKVDIQGVMDIARSTGFATDAVGKAFVKLKTGNIDPLNGSLQSLTNAVAKFGGSSDTLDHAALAIMQMSGKGVISMEELRRQLGEAVPSAMKIMASSANMTMLELTKAVSSGTVAAGPAITLMLNEMQRRYTGAAEKIRQTLAGQLAELKTNMFSIAASFTQLDDNGNGLFAGTLKNLRDLNTMLQSREGQQFAKSVGGAIAGIADDLAKAVRFIVEWRDVAFAAFKMVAMAAGLVLAKNLAGWASAQATAFTNFAASVNAAFARVGNAIAVEVQLATAVATGNAVMIDSANAMKQRTAAAEQSILAIANATAAADAAAVQSAAQNVAAKQAVIDAIAQESAQYRAQMPIVAQQIAGAKSSLNAALNLSAAKRAIGQETAASDAVATAAEAELAAQTTTLTRLRALDRKAVSDLIIAEGELAAAVKAEAAARITAEESMAGAVAACRASIIAENEAMTAASFSSRALATAQGIAAAATDALGVAVKALLSPVGIGLVLALYQAASAAGVFKTKLDAAGEAADAVGNKIGNLAQVEKAKQGIETINAALDKLAAHKNSTVGQVLGTANSVLSLGGLLGTDSTDKAISTLTAQRDKMLADLKKGTTSAIASSASDVITKFDQNVSQAIANRTQKYTDIVTSLDAKLAGATGADKTRLIAQKAAAQAAMDAVPYDMAVNFLAHAKAAYAQATGSNAPQAKIEAIAQIVKAASDRVASAQQQMIDKGKANADGLELLSGKAGKLTAEQRALMNSTAALAGAQAKLAGEGQKLAEFNAQLAGGKFKGYSEEDIQKLRDTAAGIDAIHAAMKGKREEETFEQKLASVYGRIAQLQTAAEDGSNALGRFNAELAHGGSKDLTKDQVARMRAALSVLDQASNTRSNDSTIKNLAEQFDKARTKADSLWKSYNAGTIEADKRTADVSGQFAPLFDKLKGDSSEAAQQIRDLINKTIKATNDAAMSETAHNWDEQTATILSSLKDQDTARRENFEREMDRQRQLIAATEMTEDRRAKVIASFERYESARRKEFDRQQEGSAKQMLRSMTDISKGLNDVITNSIGQLVDGIASGKLNIANFVVSVVEQIMKVIVAAMIAYAILSAIGMTPASPTGKPMSMGQFVKGGLSNFATSMGSGPTMVAGKNHTGGFAGRPPDTTRVAAAVFESARKYHEGGFVGGNSLTSDEVPIIAKKRELVLTEAQQDNLASKLNGNGSVPEIQVNIINNSGTQVTAETGQPHFNAGKLILDVVLDAASKDTSFRSGLKGALSK